MVDKQKTPGAKKAFKDMFGDTKIYQIDDHGIEDQKAKKDKSRKADKAPVAEGINGEWTKERSRREDENIKAVKKTYGDFRTTVGKNSKEKMKEIAASMNESWVVKMPISNPDKTGKEINKKFLDRGIDYQDMGWDKEGNLTVEFDDEKEAKRGAVILRSFRHSSKNQMPKIMKESYSDVRDMYVSTIPEILDEIADLVDTLDDYQSSSTPSSVFDWKYLYRSLEDVRDTILRATPDDMVGIEGTDDMNESELNEVSQKRKDEYVKRAATDAGLANFSKRSTVKDDEKKKFGEIERKRKAGLNMALKRESLEEAFSSGSLKLDDGSTYNLTSDEAKSLNKLMGSTKEKDRMTKRIKKSKSDLESMLKFSKEV